MVLRKPPPPRLESHRKESSRSNTRPLISPGPKSASSAPTKRLTRTRPRRAQSSPQPRYLVSQESIFYPDLNTSPAFDLMSLEQAQKSPVETTSSDPQNPWTDELADAPNQRHPEYAPSAPVTPNGLQEGKAADRGKGERVPSILLAGTQRRMATGESQPNEEVSNAGVWDNTKPTPIEPQSNNPFLKPRQSDQNPWQSESAQGQQSLLNVRGSGTSDALSQSEGYIPMTARLSLLDQPQEESPWGDEHTSHHPIRETAPQGPSEPFSMPDGQHGSQGMHEQMPWQPSESTSSEGYQPSYAQQAQSNVTTSNSATHPSTTQSHALIDLEDDNQPVHSAQETNGNEIHRKPIGSAPPLPQRSNDAETSVTNNQEKSEMYSIRHVNWSDRTGKLRQSPMLSQNENGPCPLLALVNALVLRANEDGETPVVRALKTREQISLGLLIQALFEELITCLGPDDEFPDIDALSRFLTMLHTGMNVNPRLTLENGDIAGLFEQTNDIRFYSTFGVPLVHGWVADPTSNAHAALMRTAQYHEDIQLLQFRKDDLEERVIRGGTLSFDEEQSMGDIHTIQKFVDVDNATQLSTFGLDHIRTQLEPGSVSILFRNDHFSTLYKHPQSQELYTLVTDAGYANHAEIVWESLVDVSGSRAGFFSGDFRPVGNNPSGPTEHSGRPTAAARTQDSGRSADGNESPSQEQSDADYAYALALQFQEEEQRENSRNEDSQNRRTSASQSAGQGRDSGHNRSSSTTYRGNNGPFQSDEEYLQHQASQSSEPNDMPPPTYEQAARGRLLAHRRNLSSAPPNNRHPRVQPQPGRRPPQPVAAASSGLPDRVKDRSKDCIVM